MEISPEEVIQTTDHPIELFYSALNNPATRRNYINMLKKIMCEYLKPLKKLFGMNNVPMTWTRIYKYLMFFRCHNNYSPQCLLVISSNFS